MKKARRVRTDLGVVGLGFANFRFETLSDDILPDHRLGNSEWYIRDKVINGESNGKDDVFRNHKDKESVSDSDWKNQKNRSDRFLQQISKEELSGPVSQGDASSLTRTI
jgi:hypothetical protein